MVSRTANLTRRSSVSEPSIRLALGSLVLGLVGLILSFLLWGAVFAFVGLVLGCLHLLRHDVARDMAIAGTCIALVGLLYCVVFAGVYRQTAQEPAEEVIPEKRGPELAGTGSGLRFEVGGVWGSGSVGQ